MSKKTSVKLEITNCAQCPHSRAFSYSLDGWDRGDRYTCNNADGRVIDEFCEWNDPRPTPPAWCPLRVKKK